MHLYFTSKHETERSRLYTESIKCPGYWYYIRNRSDIKRSRNAFLMPNCRLYWTFLIQTHSQVKGSGIWCFITKMLPLNVLILSSFDPSKYLFSIMSTFRWLFFMYLIFITSGRTSFIVVTLINQVLFDSLHQFVY